MRRTFIMHSSWYIYLIYILLISSCQGNSFMPQRGRQAMSPWNYQQNAAELKYLCIVREPHVYVPSTCPTRRCLPSLSLALSHPVPQAACGKKKQHFDGWNVCVNLFIVLINVNSLQLPAIKGRRTSCCNTHHVACGMWQPVAVACAQCVW